MDELGVDDADEIIGSDTSSEEYYRELSEQEVSAYPDGCNGYGHFDVTDEESKFVKATFHVEHLDNTTFNFNNLEVSWTNIENTENIKIERNGGRIFHILIS